MESTFVHYAPEEPLSHFATYAALCIGEIKQSSRRLAVVGIRDAQIILLSPLRFEITENFHAKTAIRFYATPTSVVPCFGFEMTRKIWTAGQSITLGPAE